jgi:hypothetical protein
VKTKTKIYPIYGIISVNLRLNTVPNVKYITKPINIVNQNINEILHKRDINCEFKVTVKIYFS